MGSGSWPQSQRRSKSKLTKTIVAKGFPNRRSASEYEAYLIEVHYDDPQNMNISKAVQMPCVGIPRVYKNHLAFLLSSGILSLGPVAASLWIELIGSGCRNGVSSKILAGKVGCTIEECNRLMEKVSDIKNDLLPIITRKQNTWIAL